MYQHTRFNNKNNFFQKFGSLDYVLLSCLLILGFISLATMYSTDGGEVLFHTKSHFIKFIVFFLMMIVISFINIKFWFSLGYLSYAVILGMLIWTINFGITASGSKRWIDLYLLPRLSYLSKLLVFAGGGSIETQSSSGTAERT